MLVAFGFVRGSLVCYQEYMYGIGNPYRDLYGGLRLQASTYTPIDDVLNAFKVNASGFDNAFDIPFIISIVCDALSAFYAFTAPDWLSFSFGHNAGSGAAKVFFLLDKVASLKIIVPKKPWVTIV